MGIRTPELISFVFSSELKVQGGRWTGMVDCDFLFSFRNSIILQVDAECQNGLSDKAPARQLSTTLLGTRGRLCSEWMALLAIIKCLQGDGLVML